MTANQLRTMYVNFFKERGHKEIASASLLPENDPTVLFTTAGMHPLPCKYGSNEKLNSSSDFEGKKMEFKNLLYAL